MFLNQIAKIHIFCKLPLLLYFKNNDTMDFSIVLNSTYTLTLLALLALSLLVLCLYYGLVWMRVGLYKNNRIPKADTIEPKNLPSVSVVLVAQNESENLKKCLPYLLEQDYPDFEVVVVDYLSHNDTETKFVLRVCAENYPNLKPVSFPEDINMFHGKKYPLSIGIKSATKDVVLLTEPDCIPSSFNWIREMMCGYMRGADIVLGYNTVQTSGNLLGALQNYDNLAETASYMGFAIMGNPYTGTGRNLTFKRKFFFDHGAFIKHYSIPDGADDLFVNQNANKRNIAIILSPDAEVCRPQYNTFQQWHENRVSRRSTRRYYPLGDRLMLSVYPLAIILFLVSLVLLWTNIPSLWVLPASVLALKVIWQIVCSCLLAKRFKIKIIQFLSPFFELYFLFANTFLSLTTLRRIK